MKNSNRTVNGVYLQNCLYQHLPFNMLPNTTLNEALNIQSGVAPGQGVYPKAAYFGIGNGGIKATTTSDGLVKIQASDHYGDHAGFYRQLPFVMRALDNDLAVVERARYALRRIETHNYTQYAVYYLRRLDMTNVVPELQTLNIVDGITTVTAYSPTSGNLNPTPPLVQSTGVNTVNGVFITASSKNIIVFTANDIAELVNVSNILFNDPDYAIISEIGIVAAVDKTVNVPSEGNTVISFNEVISAQIVSFINTTIIASAAGGGTTTEFDLGATEPLFSLG